MVCTTFLSLREGRESCRSAWGDVKPDLEVFITFTVAVLSQAMTQPGCGSLGDMGRHPCEASLQKFRELASVLHQQEILPTQMVHDMSSPAN